MQNEKNSNNRSTLARKLNESDERKTEKRIIFAPVNFFVIVDSDAVALALFILFILI